MPTTVLNLTASAAPAVRSLTPERVQRFIDDIRAAKAEAQQCVPLARGVAAFPLRASLFAARLEILLQALVGELAGADAAQQVQNAIDAPWTDFDAAEFLRGLAGATLFNLDAQVH